MKFRADISVCEDDEDKVLSVSQCDAEGYVQDQIIIQRGPKEFDALDDAPGPRISCEALGLDLAPGPEEITFSGDLMTIVLSDGENIEVDISGLERDEKSELRAVAKKLFE